MKKTLMIFMNIILVLLMVASGVSYANENKLVLILPAECTESLQKIDIFDAHNILIGTKSIETGPVGDGKVHIIVTLDEKNALSRINIDTRKSQCNYQAGITGGLKPNGHIYRFQAASLLSKKAIKSSGNKVYELQLVN